MRQIAVIDNIYDDYAIVSVKRTTACGENCASCGGGCIATTKQVRAQNLTNAKKGDNVIIEIADKNVLFGAFCVYIAPLLIMFCTYITSSFFIESEIISFCLGFVIFVIAFFLLKKTDNYLMKSGKYKIYITRNLNFSANNDIIS